MKEETTIWKRADKCPKCGSTQNESLGNDFHCENCWYTECVDEPTLWERIKNWFTPIM